MREGKEREIGTEYWRKVRKTLMKRTCKSNESCTETVFSVCLVKKLKDERKKEREKMEGEGEEMKTYLIDNKTSPFG